MTVEWGGGLSNLGNAEMSPLTPQTQYIVPNIVNIHKCHISVDNIKSPFRKKRHFKIIHFSR